ncbi:MAG: Gfo/Idh/MocA family oxidoreductase [Planctomycetota bacterium]|jgi:predicted dehydrogenase
MKALRVGVVGVGHLGSRHAHIYRGLEGADLVGVVDILPGRAAEIGRETGVPHFTDHTGLFGKVDAVSIAVPTAAHCAIAKDFLEQGTPVLVEKPLAKTIAEAEELVRLSRARKVPLCVGHVERFNPAVAPVLDLVRRPRFVEVHRLAPFSFRSTDIDVVMDLMIHDLDIILHVARSPIRRVDAVGLSLLFGKEDIANARVEFEDGCVANLTASRISGKAMRKIRFFSEDCYISVDTMEKKAQIYRTTPGLAEAIEKLPKDGEPTLADLASIPKEFYSIEEISLPNEQPLEKELAAFVDCVREGREPVVTGEHGVRAMKAAQAVLKELREHRWT